VTNEYRSLDLCSVHDGLDIVGHLIERIFLPASRASAHAALVDCDHPESLPEKIYLINPERAYASEAGYKKDRMAGSDVFVE
jgi:hypothetical protein